MRIVALAIVAVGLAVPIQPWAKALLDERHARFLADEPYTRCKPSPAARAVQTAYGVEFLNLPGTGRIYLFQTVGAHSFRVIYLDGRSHPAQIEPSCFGHSIGGWDGDTLVVHTVGYNEGAWMERWGMPHTSQLRESPQTLTTTQTEESVQMPEASAHVTNHYLSRIVPWKDPGPAFVRKLNNRSIVKLPLASANRPVPPVIVAFSTMRSTAGSFVGKPDPVQSAVSLSPLAAVNSYVPIPTPVARLTVSS
jgi:hypothetical protein